MTELESLKTPGSRNPYFRYLGYRNLVIDKQATEDQKRAWLEGQALRSNKKLPESF